MAASPEKYIIPVLSKALDILEAFRSTDDVLTLRQVMDRTGVAHATAFRVLCTLVYRGYLAREGTHYRIAKIHRKPVIGYAFLSERVAISVAVARSLQKATAASGMDLMLLNNDENTETAIQNARRFVENDVNVVVEFQNNVEIAPVIADIFSTARIPVISIHIPQPGAIYFGPDNFRAGRTAGAALAEHASDCWGARFDLAVLLDIPQGGPTLQSRVTGVLAGMEQALGKIPPSKVLRLDGGGDRVKSREAVASALSTHSRSRRLLIAATSDESALGALDVVRASGLASTSAIVGHDGAEEALQALGERNSPFIGTVAFFPEDYGRQLVQLSARILRGDAVPPFVYVPHRLVTRKNLRRISAGANA